MFNTRMGWGWPARLIHWASAGLILFLLGLGVYMTNFVDDVYAQFGLFQTHKSWGFVAFVLGVLRIGWRLANPSPALPEGMPAIERLAAKAGHLALYLLVIAMPLTGWLTASASPLQDSYGIKNMVFGWFEMPDPIVPGTQALEDLFSTMHYVCGIALTALILGHVAVALRHQFVKRDGLLRRMVLGR